MRSIALSYLRTTIPLCRPKPLGVYVQIRAMATDDSAPLVLVTGATGYIATHVTQQLLLSGKYRVRGTVRSLKNEEKLKPVKELVPDAKYPLELCEADLQNKDSWPAAVQDCQYVWHLASPFPAAVPKNPEEEVIRPAVDGTINVLTACAESGTVKKVILTSSIAAVSCGLLGHPGRKEHVYTEEDWSPPEACNPYERSKTLAEKAAWDFLKELPAEKKFEMAAVNPGVVMGPALTASAGTSLGILMGMLTGAVPGFPDVSTAVVDVRDVAKAQIAAMEKSTTNGNRYLLISESHVPFLQAAQWVKEEFGPQGYKIGTKKVPKLIAWFGSKFNPDLKAMYPAIGKKLTLMNKKMVEELEIQPRSARESFIDAAYSVIELGMVQKTPNYHGPNDAK